MVVLCQQFVLHVTLERSLERVGQQFGKTVIELLDTEGPVQHQRLGLGAQLSQDLKDTLQ